MVCVGITAFYRRQWWRVHVVHNLQHNLLTTDDKMSSNSFRVTHDGTSHIRHPPIDGVDTDVDSDLSDDDHACNLNHLGRNILGSIYEVQTARKDDQDTGLKETQSQISSPLTSIFVPSTSSGRTALKRPQRNIKTKKAHSVMSDSDPEDALPSTKKQKLTNTNKNNKKTAKQIALEQKNDPYKSMENRGAQFFSKHKVSSNTMF
ncbi:hypothetical protein J6590_082625 [Homalodisca vitripennis]|nr:hypothetical protein J6590_082625 [Homalodisca vitripennis]